MFYFTSESRIDFRSMVRDLAHELHTRIELRQVGARDEARLTADYEKCGQHCCCKSFLKVLTPISMRSAKVQKATLDPAKISGRCGRLMCCLRYEDQTYEELKKKLPKRNTRVKTPTAEAWVIDGQILTQLVLVQYDDNKREAVPLEKIEAFDLPRPKLPDGRTMQSPNDRPPEMRLPLNAGGRGARGPMGAGGPRGSGPGAPGGSSGPAGPGGPGAPGQRMPRGRPPLRSGPGGPGAAGGPTEPGVGNAPRQPGPPQGSPRPPRGPGQPRGGPRPPERPRPGRPLLPQPGEDPNVPKGDLTGDASAPPAAPTPPPSPPARQEESQAPPPPAAPSGSADGAGPAPANE
jgi:hypothetical protein